jgi:hypothetical protein
MTGEVFQEFQNELGRLRVQYKDDPRKELMILFLTALERERIREGYASPWPGQGWTGRANTGTLENDCAIQCSPLCPSAGRASKKCLGHKIRAR